MDRKETIIADTFDPDTPPWVVNPPPDTSTPESDADARQALHSAIDSSFEAGRDQMEMLSRLLHERNTLDERIGKLIGRPALAGHIGEYIAAEVFDITLEESASSAAIDGRFTSGPLAGNSVNVKLYGKLEGVLDLPTGVLSADYTLVLVGPASSAGTSRGGHRPVVISGAYLFHTGELLANLRERGVRIGVATNVAKRYWEAAEIYPRGTGGPLVVDDRQRELLGLFGPERLLS